MPRSDLRDEPTNELIGELAQWNDSAWGAQTKLDQRIIDLCFSQNNVAVEDTNDPQRLRRYKPERLLMGEAARIVELLRSLYPHLASLGLMWAGEGTRGDSDRDANERAINEALDQLNPVQDAPNTADTWGQVALGRGVRMQLPGHNYYWDFPHMQTGESEEAWLDRWQTWRHQAPVPMTWVSLPPETTFPPSWGALGQVALSKLKTTWWGLLDAFSEEEIAALEFHKDGNRLMWKPNVEAHKEFQFGPRATATIAEALKALDKAEALDGQTMSLFEKFVDTTEYDLGGEAG